MIFQTLLAAASIVATPIEAPGPSGPLAGTLTDAGKGSPIVLILPGSGQPIATATTRLASLPRPIGFWPRASPNAA